MATWDLLYTSNRLIDSGWNLQRDSCIPKALPADQSQPTSSGYANYYAARWLNGHCKYMSRKTIAFWAMRGTPHLFVISPPLGYHFNGFHVRYGHLIIRQISFYLMCCDKLDVNLYSTELWTLLPLCAPVNRGAIIILDHIWRSIQSRKVNFYECIILHCLKKSKVQPTVFDSFLIFSYFGRERFSKPRKGEFGGWAFIRWER